MTINLAPIPDISKADVCAHGRRGMSDNIPEAAVQAAGEALLDAGWSADGIFEDARAALTAALPHLTAAISAKAWEEGAEAAYYDPESRWQVRYPANPYHHCRPRSH